MDDKKCTAYDIKTNEGKNKIHRTVCKRCYNKRKRKNNINSVPEEQNNDNSASFSANENHRNVMNGPSNSDKSYYMLKKRKGGNKKPIHIITRFANQ